MKILGGALDSYLRKYYISNPRRDRGKFGKEKWNLPKDSLDSGLHGDYICNPPTEKAWKAVRKKILAGLDRRAEWTYMECPPL